MTRLSRLLFASVVLLAAGAAIAQDGPPPQPPEGQGQAEPAAAFDTPEKRSSYAIGQSVGRSLQRDGVTELDFEVFLDGLRDALGNKSDMNDEQLRAAFVELQERLQRQQDEKAAAALERGRQFLEENKKKEGVQTTASGLQYEVLRPGTGDSPKATDRVRVHYRGTLIDGTEFDSSYSRGQPAEFPVNGVIRGWVEALQLMKVGAKWKLTIPAELAYGQNAPPKIGPNQVLIFEVELLDILK